MSGGDDSWHQRLIAATFADGGHAVASPRAAARLHRLDGFEQCGVVEVSVTNGHRWRRGSEVISHHVATLDTSDVLTIEAVVAAHRREL